MNELFHAVFDGLNFMSNVEFVRTVLSMDSTSEPDSWRAIDSPFAAFIAYSLIWIAHAVSGVLCLAGTYSLATAWSRDDTDFSRAAAISTAGVGIGCVLYLVGFLAIASGWFLLHEAPTPPNFIREAMLLFLCYVAVLIYLALARR